SPAPANPPSPPSTLSLHDALPISELLQRETVRGVAVNAAATHSILNVVGTAGAGLVGIAGTAGVNVLRGSTEAYVDGTSLNTSRSEEHTSELQSRENLVCRLLLEK